VQLLRRCHCLRIIYTCRPQSYPHSASPLLSMNIGPDRRFVDIGTLFREFVLLICLPYMVRTRLIFFSNIFSMSFITGTLLLPPTIHCSIPI
jgi:hypothetical protein